MIKKSFRLMLLVAFALSSVMFVACNKYDDDIERIDNQIAAMEQTLQSLKAAIDGGVVITGVNSTAEGITFTMSNGQSYKINHGTNGANGADGKSTVITIGENGNWVIDGVDTGKPAVGKSAETVYYYPCTDKEHECYGEWVKVTGDKEEATGNSWLHDGVLTAVYDSENGVLTIKGVEGAENGEYVIYTSAQLGSIAIVPNQTNGSPVGVIDEATGYPVVQSYSLLITTTSSSPYTTINSQKYNLVQNNNLNLLYRLNPTNAQLNGVEFSFVDRIVTTRSEGDDDALVAFKGYENVEGGILVDARLALHKKWLEDEADKMHNIFALKASLPEIDDVVSDYAKLISQDLTKVEIVRVCDLPSIYVDYEHDDNFVQVYKSFTSSSNPTLNNAKTTLKGKGVVASFGYNETIDLDDVAALCLPEIEELAANVGFDVTYEFSMLEEFCVVDDTEQDYFVSFDAETNIVSVVKGASAIGRTPAFMVKAMVNGTVMQSALFKVGITKGVVTPALTYTYEFDAIEYSDIMRTGSKNASGKDITTKLVLPWDVINDEIYDKLNLSHDQFMNIYVTERNGRLTDHMVNYKPSDDERNIVLYGHTCTGSAKKTRQSNGGYHDGVLDNNKRGVLVNLPWSSNSTTTNGIELFFEPNNIHKFSKDTITVMFRAEDNRAYGDVNIHLVYEVKHDKVFPVVNPDYQIENTEVKIGARNDYETISVPTVVSYGQFDGKTWDPTTQISEMFENYLTDKNGKLLLPGNHKNLKINYMGVVDQYDYTERAKRSLTFVENFVDSDMDYLKVAIPGSLFVTSTITRQKSGDPAITETIGIANGYKLNGIVGPKSGSLIAETNGRIGVFYVSVEMDNGDVCDGYVAVKFVSPISVSVKDINIKQNETGAVAESFTDAVVVTMQLNSSATPVVIWENGALTEAGRKAGIALNANMFAPQLVGNTTAYSVVTDATFDANNEKLFVGIVADCDKESDWNSYQGQKTDDEGKLYDYYKFDQDGEVVVVWDNGNKTLAQDKVATSVVQLQIGDFATAVGTGTVTILK